MKLPEPNTTYVPEIGPHLGHTVLVRKVATHIVSGEEDYILVCVICVPCREKWNWILGGHAEQARLIEELMS